MTLTKKLRFKRSIYHQLTWIELRQFILSQYRQTLSASMVLAASLMTFLASLVFWRLMKTIPPSQQIMPTVPAHISSFLAIIVQRSGNISIMPAEMRRESVQKDWLHKYDHVTSGCACRKKCIHAGLVMLAELFKQDFDTQCHVEIGKSGDTEHIECWLFVCISSPSTSSDDWWLEMMT